MTNTLEHVEPCRSCRTPIAWATVTMSGKTMPINPQPSPHGNVDVVKVGRTYVAQVIGNRTRCAAMIAAGRPLYLSHFTDCPHASNWRKR